MSISIHSGDVGLPKLFDIDLDERDALDVRTRVIDGVDCHSAELVLGWRSPFVNLLKAATRSHGHTVVFIRVTQDDGNEIWARCQQWVSNGDLTATFDQAYTSGRIDPDGRVFYETRVEPSPPVAFDAHHPHYEGSAQQYLNEERKAS